MTDRTKPDLPGAAGCVLLMALGAAAWWAAADYSDLGAVFPRAMGGLLVVLGATYLVLVALGRTRRASQPAGSPLRRALVAAVMLAWAFALGPWGFLYSSAAAGAALLLVAQHERWRLRSALLYAAAFVVVLLGLYALFKHALLVPLP